MLISQMVLGGLLSSVWGTALSGRSPDMEQFRGSIVLSAILLLTGLVAVVLMGWVLISGGWLWVGP